VVTIENEPLIDLPTLCKELGFTENKVRRLIRDCRICPAIKKPGKERFYLSVVKFELRTAKLN